MAVLTPCQNSDLSRSCLFLTRIEATGISKCNRSATVWLKKEEQLTLQFKDSLANEDRA